MTNRMKERMNSDQADSLTISQILWITFTVVLVLFVGQKIYAAVSAKGNAVSDCIKSSNTLFTATASTCADSKP